MKVKEWDISEAVCYLESAIKKGEIPGATLGIVADGDYTHLSIGKAGVIEGKTIELDDDMLYDLASCTKVVATTTIILKCIEKGMLSLKTAVIEILKDFPYSEINIEHLLTHTSGIISDDKKYKELADKESIKNFIYSKQLSFNPGEKVEYSDFGYIILGFIIEELIGEIDEIAKEWIFDPLKMHNTYYQPFKYVSTDRCVPTEYTNERGMIRGVVHDGKAFRLNGLSGNAGLFSTVDDLCHFTLMMLNDGKYNNERILSSSTINNLKKCYTEKLNLRRTLGWFVNEGSAPMGDYYSDTCLFHTGFTGTSIYIDYKRKISIILLTNRVHPTRKNANIVHIRNITHNLLLKKYDEGKEEKECR